MMQRMFHRNNHEVPALNTSSLPDLIFTVLFFFMIVTHMRDVELKVRYEVPQGTELQKLTHKSAVIYIYVGRCYTASHQTDGEDMQIQLTTGWGLMGIMGWDLLKLWRANPHNRLKIHLNATAPQ